MKLTHLLIPAIMITLGCSTVQKPPTAIEQKLFTVATNYTPAVTAATNPVVVVNPETQVAATNYVVSNVTNWVLGYVFTPNTNAAAIGSTAGAFSNLVTPGSGGVVAGLIGTLFGAYASWRSKKNKDASAAMAQIIETGEQVMLTMPNGQKTAAEWKAWMIKHQAETKTISEASQLVANLVDTEDARKAAATISTATKQ